MKARLLSWLRDPFMVLIFIVVAVPAAAREAQVAEENNQHEQNKKRLRLISMVTSKYLDEETTRHQSAIQKVEADYQASLRAVNCQP